MNDVRILMVCLGNICRSPIAEGVLRDHLDRIGINARVDSCGTSDWHEGEAPDKRAIQACEHYGLDISNQRSRPVTKTDFDVFDYIFAMDENNYNDLMALTENETHRQKLHLYLEFAEVTTRRAVPDPYYGTITDFFEVYTLLDEASARVAQKIQAGIKEV